MLVKFFGDAKVVLVNLVEVCKLLIKISVPVAGGFIVSDILFATNFGVVDRCVGMLKIIGIQGNVLTVLIAIVVGVVLYQRNPK